MSILKTGSVRGLTGSADSLTLHTSDQSVTFPGDVTHTGTSTFNKPARGPTTTLSSSSSEVAVDLSLRNNYTLALAENTTIKNPSGEVVGQSGSIFITQDGTGSRTAAWESHYLWAGGTAPTLTTTASAVDRIDYIVLDSDKVHCVASLDVK